jgi:hypothetical protein
VRGQVRRPLRGSRSSAPIPAPGWAARPAGCRLDSGVRGASGPGCGPGGGSGDGVAVGVGDGAGGLNGTGTGCGGGSVTGRCGTQIPFGQTIGVRGAVAAQPVIGRRTRTATCPGSPAHARRRVADVLLPASRTHQTHQCALWGRFGCGGGEIDEFGADAGDPWAARSGSEIAAVCTRHVAGDICHGPGQQPHPRRATARRVRARRRCRGGPAGLPSPGSLGRPDRGRRKPTLGTLRPVGDKEGDAKPYEDRTSGLLVVGREGVEPTANK